MVILNKLFINNYIQNWNIKFIFNIFFIYIIIKKSQSKLCERNEVTYLTYKLQMIKVGDRGRRYGGGGGRGGERWGGSKIFIYALPCADSESHLYREEIFNLKGQNYGYIVENRYL